MVGLAMVSVPADAAKAVWPLGSVIRGRRKTGPVKPAGKELIATGMEAVFPGLIVTRRVTGVVAAPPEAPVESDESRTLTVTFPVIVEPVGLAMMTICLIGLMVDPTTRGVAGRRPAIVGARGELLTSGAPMGEEGVMEILESS